MGSAAIQHAKARGAKLIAITSPSKADGILKLGALKVMLRGENLVQSLGKDSVDVAIDLVAGKQWSELLGVLKQFAR